MAIGAHAVHCSSAPRAQEADTNCEAEAGARGVKGADEGESPLNPSPASIWGSILSNMASNPRSPLDRSLSVFARSKSLSGDINGDAGLDGWHHRVSTT